MVLFHSHKHADWLGSFSARLPPSTQPFSSIRDENLDLLPCPSHPNHNSLACWLGAFMQIRNGNKSYCTSLYLQERVQVGNGALSISRLTLADVGMYQCVAGNKHGEVYSNAELRVIGKANQTQFACVYVCIYMSRLHYSGCAVCFQVCATVPSFFPTRKWPRVS